MLNNQYLFEYGVRRSSLSIDLMFLIVIIVGSIHLDPAGGDTNDYPKTGDESKFRVEMEQQDFELISLPHKRTFAYSEGELHYHFPDFKEDDGFIYYYPKLNSIIEGVIINIHTEYYVYDNEPGTSILVYSFHAEPGTKPFKNRSVSYSIYWENENRTISGVSGTYLITLSLQPYFEFSAIITDDLNEITEQVGRWKEVRFQIHNQGNYLTEFKFEDYETDDLDFRVPEEGLILDVDQKGMMTLEVRQKEGLGRSNHIDLNITATSMDRERTLEYSFVFRSTPGKDSLTTPYFCFIWLVLLIIATGIFVIISKARNRNN